MKEYPCYLYDRIFGEQRGQSHYLYHHASRDDVALKEQDPELPDPNVDDEVDNVTGNVPDHGDSMDSSDSKGHIDGASLMQEEEEMKIWQIQQMQKLEK